MNTKEQENWLTQTFANAILEACDDTTTDDEEFISRIDTIYRAYKTQLKQIKGK